jgi:Skp family chaperone for outer membrane proteins
VKSKVFLWPVLALAVTLTAQAQQGKIAVINIQGAIISTKDGQKAAAELNAKTAPKKKELEQKQNDINALQDQLNKGSNTLSDSAKNDIYKNIESKKKSLQREVEDAQADLEADQNKLLQQLGQKILAVIEKYSRDNGFTLVVDVSSPQTLRQEHCGSQLSGAYSNHLEAPGCCACRTCRSQTGCANQASGTITRVPGFVSRACE